MTDKRSFMQTELNRRKALGVTVGVAGGIAINSTVAQSATPGASPSASPTVQEGMSRSEIEGVPDAYWQIPEPFQSYEGTPANGGTVRYVHLIWGAPVKARDENVFWQELEKRLGLDEFKITEMPVASYDEKITAQIAGQDMGDLIWLNPQIGGASMIYDATEQGAFLDLTGYLTGDNLQNYPNLAALPQVLWDQSKIGGRIYGIPTPLYQGHNYTMYRKDWADDLGIVAPTSGDEFVEFMRAFTEDDPDGNGANDTYGSGVAWSQLYDCMYHVPYEWRLNDDGSLTRYFETEEFLQAIDFRRSVWDAGYVHPDAPSVNSTQMNTMFDAGTTGTMSEGFGIWWGPDGRMEQIKRGQPDAVLDAIIPFGHDGGPGATYPLNAFYGWVSIPEQAATDEERIQTLLRICDYLYPPFGSEEYLFQTYGIEGTHYTLEENGTIKSTPQGDAELPGLIYGFEPNGLYIFHAGFEEHARRRQELIEIASEHYIHNPVLGLFSEMQANLGPAADQVVGDAAWDYTFGRATRDDVLQAIEDWRTRGGDEIRADFERLIAERDAASEATPAS